MYGIKDIVLQIEFVSKLNEELTVEFPGEKIYAVMPMISSHVKNGGTVLIYDIVGKIHQIAETLNELFYIIGVYYQTGNMHIEMDEFITAFIDYGENPIIAGIIDAELADK